MPHARKAVKVALAAAVVVLLAWAGAGLLAQAANPQPINDLPNPFKTIENWAQLPDGRKGAIAAVAVDRDGKSIWVLERCGQNSCVADPATGKMSDLNPIMLFDSTGKLVRSFGAGMFSGPHRVFVDRDGNVWVTDYADNAPRKPAAPGAAPAAPAPKPPDPSAPPPPTTISMKAPREGATVGHQVVKFSPEGKVLLTLGKAGGAAPPDFFLQPCDILVLPSGDFLVSTGHGQAEPSVYKFSRDGKLIKKVGTLGTGPNDFDQAHSLAIDSKGRVYIGDRNNNRIKVVDQDLNYISEIKTWSRPSGIFIDRNDTLYCADSESDSVSRNHNGWRRGIRLGPLSASTPKYFIPDPNTKTRSADNFTSTWSAEGVTVDAAGNIYGAEVGNQKLMKYEPIKEQMK
jgi:streptogramin lyase